MLYSFFPLTDISCNRSPQLTLCMEASANTKKSSYPHFRKASVFQENYSEWAVPKSALFISCACSFSSTCITCRGSLLLLPLPSFSKSHLITGCHMQMFCQASLTSHEVYFGVISQRSSFLNYMLSF